MRTIRRSRTSIVVTAAIGPLLILLLASPLSTVSERTNSVDSIVRLPTGILPLVLSDGQFVYGPNVKSFDSARFIKQHAELSDVDAQEFNCIALRYSINPKVLLTIIEMQSRLVSAPSPTAIAAPIGYAGNLGFTSQVNLLAEHLSQAFYWHLYQYQPRRLELAQPELHFEDGSTEPITGEMNAATYAVQSVLAEVSTPDRWQRLVSQDARDGFYQTYLRLFPDDDPLDTSNILNPNAIPPAGLLKLPFACHDRWLFAGGPHGVSVWSAVDFAPYSGSCDAPPANKWVVAAAGGVVVSTCGTCGVEIDHGVDGWQTFYYHLTNLQVSKGDHVAENQPLGNPSCSVCCGGSATGVHVHFDIEQNGLMQPIAGTSLEGWVVHAGTYAYDGYLQRGGTTISTGEWVTSEDCGHIVIYFPMVLKQP